MGQKSDSGQSSPSTPRTTLPFSPASPLFDEPQTVINPERRGAAALAHHLPALPGSSLLHRLFPPETPDPGRSLKQPAGSELGHFVIEERIGAGGMGAVFRAVDQRLKRLVALKVLAPSQSRDSASIQRFHNEAQAAARLDHDNIARVYYIGEDQGLQFIAFEYVTGTNVRELIRNKGRLNVAEAVSYALQIAMALNHTAAADVVHRDIKPSNIIISPNGRAKLVDLGLARKKSADSTGDLTMAGTTLGTFDYISPEQARDPRNVDVRSDIYSLGCTLYHMLTGEAPYPEGTVMQKLLDHQGKQPPDPAEKNRAVGSELSAIVQKMMASEPWLRHASPDELIRDLMRIAGGLGLRGIHPDGLIWTSSKNLGRRFWERNLGWMATAAVLLLIVFLLESSPLQFQTPNPQNANNPQVKPIGEANAAQNNPRIATDRPPPTDYASRFTGSTLTEGPQKLIPLANGVKHPQDTDSESGRLPTKNLFEDPDLSIISNTTSQPPVPPVNPSEPLNPSDAHVSDGTPRAAPAIALKPKPVSQLAVVNVKEISITGEGKSYKTLEAACAAAEDGNVIELRWNGPRKEKEKPLRVANKKITIRAAKEYRPLIEFEPQYVPGEGWETRMITVTKGRLDLIDLDLAMTVQQHVESDRWSLLALHGADEVRLQGVNVTIINPDAVPAGVFELTSGPAGDMEMMTEQDGALPEFKIRIVDSFVRGEGDLFVTAHTRPGRFEVEKSAVAIEGALLSVFGNRDQREDGASIELELEHVTALVGNSVLRMDSGDESRETLTVRVSARDNIFAATKDRPLIAMTGNTNAEDFRNRLRWEGTKNVYDRFELFWSIASSQVLGDDEKYDFEAWKKRWSDTEVDPYKLDVVWKHTWRNQIGSLSEITPFDLELDSGTAAFSALFEAGDGTSVGADLTKLRDRAPLEIPASTSN